MIKYLFTQICFLLVCAVTAQPFVQGKVTGPDNRPLPMVSITLTRNADGPVLAFAITNTAGLYQVAYNKGGSDSLWLHANIMGFKKESRQLNGAKQLDFILESAITRLPEVTVKNKTAPIIGRQDTVNYDVASFKDPQDRTIGDVIRKLPGVEMDANGKIKYQGKPISHFYIDGDDLLDSRYNIATRSLPEDMVSKVQVLENHQPIKALKDVLYSDKPAMNLIMKDKARLKISGQGDAAFGTPGLYNVTANTMMFKKAVKFINYYKLNNTGTDLAEDVIMHNLSDMLNNVGSTPPPSLLNVSGAGTPDISKKRHLFNNSGLLNINDLVKLNNDWQLRINSYYLHDKQYRNSSLSNTYYLPGDTIRYSEKQDSRYSTNNFAMQWTLTANKPGYYLNNVTLIENEPTTTVAAMQATTASHVDQRLSGTLTNISNQLNYMKVLRNKQVLDLFSYVSNTNNPATLRVDPGLYAGKFNNGNPYEALVQTVNVPTFYTNEYVSLKIAAGNWQQSYKAGFSYQQQQLNSQLDIIQMGGGQSPVADSFKNALHWNRRNLYAAAEYTYTKQKLQLSFNFLLNNEYTRYTTGQKEYELNAFPFRPYTRIRYQVGKESYLTGSYAMNNTRGNIDNVYDGYLMKNYRDFNASGELIPVNLQHNISGYYTFRNSLKILFASASLAYSFNKTNTITDSRLSDIAQQARLLEMDNRTSSITFAGNISKYLFALRTTIGIKSSWRQSTFNQLQNGNLLQYRNSNLMLGGGVNSKITSWLGLIYNGSYVTSRNTPLSASKSNTASPAAIKWQHNGEANVTFGKQVYFKASGEYYSYRLPGMQINGYLFMDVTLTWKINKWKTDLELTMNNITNTDTYSTLSLSSNNISESVYTIRPRMFLAKFLYSF
ncbi:carboxypeptidase-like regulatory domain-containing protein [Sediminibacterium ginsengisoli]|uniref:Carboxypeptidase regulatory-like domain-containing protein n=1 Tax=Sediminibacterium ginsengisoli TaxID=413434 RepID=A0A1T4L0P1_9BACT|nr:carboxypeptidase-like regulatory domain-containing protein [Sediminibacterium ginsengisoli]SJZ48294.1 hypothetical protein SAMN04488132_102238 [Sediminibacterium ginsengisoli]